MEEELAEQERCKQAAMENKRIEKQKYKDKVDQIEQLKREIEQMQKEVHSEVLQSEIADENSQLSGGVKEPQSCNSTSVAGIAVTNLDDDAEDQ